MKVISNSAELEQVITGERPVLLAFYADWYSDCQVLQPILDELSTTFEGKIDFFKINVDTHQDLAIQYNIRSIPTMLFKKSNQITDQLVGLQPLRELEMKLAQLLTQSQPIMDKITTEIYQQNPERYELVEGSTQGAPTRTYGNIREWVGYDKVAETYGRFTKSIYKRLVHDIESTYNKSK